MGAIEGDGAHYLYISFDIGSLDKRTSGQEPVPEHLEE
jgi:hypothetical protein